jgi:hypothetical protein
MKRMTKPKRANTDSETSKSKQVAVRLSAKAVDALTEVVTKLAERSTFELRVTRSYVVRRALELGLDQMLAELETRDLEIQRRPPPIPLHEKLGGKKGERK